MSKPQVIDNFVEDSFCDYIIEKYTSRLIPMTILGSDNSGFRVAEGRWLEPKTDRVLQEFTKSVSEFTNTPLENQENPHIVKYNIGGEYKPHQDYFHKNTSYYDEMMDRGGQRGISCLLYLNDDFTGGETEFPNIELTIKPKKGSMVYWSSYDAQGKLDPDTLHAGLPVISGVKYVMLVWIRERIFR